MQETLAKYKVRSFSWAQDSAYEIGVTVFFIFNECQGRSLWYIVQTMNKATGIEGHALISYVSNFAF